MIFNEIFFYQGIFQGRKFSKAKLKLSDIQYFYYDTVIIRFFNLNQNLLHNQLFSKDRDSFITAYFYN